MENQPAEGVENNTSSTNTVKKVYGDYEVLKPIGKGKFAIVYRAQKISDQTIVALKRISVDMIDAKARDKCLKEVRLLASLDHPNVIKYMDSFISENDLVIVVEWAAAGDLKRQLRKAQERGVGFEERVIWKYFSQICEAIKHMHEKRVMHRDLKPANIFLTLDGTVKVGDLGLSRELSEHTVQAHSKVGTPLYMSPEVLRGDGYDFKSDIWSLGCLLYELAMLKSPFKAEGLNLYGLFQKISAGDFTPVPDNYSEELRSLVNAMLSNKSEDRPEIASVCVAASAMREKLARKKSVSNTNNTAAATSSSNNNNNNNGNISTTNDSQQNRVVYEAPEAKDGQNHNRERTDSSRSTSHSASTVKKHFLNPNPHTDAAEEKGYENNQRDKQDYEVENKGETTRYTDQKPSQSQSNRARHEDFNIEKYPYSQNQQLSGSNHFEDDEMVRIPSGSNENVVVEPSSMNTIGNGNGNGNGYNRQDSGHVVLPYTSVPSTNNHGTGIGTGYTRPDSASRKGRNGNFNSRVPAVESNRPKFTHDISTSSATEGEENLMMVGVDTGIGTGTVGLPNVSPNAKESGFVHSSHSERSGRHGNGGSVGGRSHVTTSNSSPPIDKKYGKSQDKEVGGLFGEKSASVAVDRNNDNDRLRNSDRNRQAAHIQPVEDNPSGWGFGGNDQKERLGGLPQNRGHSNSGYDRGLDRMEQHRNDNVRSRGNENGYIRTSSGGDQSRSNSRGNENGYIRTSSGGDQSRSNSRGNGQGGRVEKKTVNSKNSKVDNVIESDFNSTTRITPKGGEVSYQQMVATSESMELLHVKLVLLRYPFKGEDHSKARMALTPLHFLCDLNILGGSDNVDSTSQFTRFLEVCMWIGNQLGQSHLIATWNVDEDAPVMLAKQVLFVSQACGVIVSDITPSSLIPGYGEKVCALLNGLADCLLKKREYSFKKPDYSNIADGGLNPEEYDDVSEEELEDPEFNMEEDGLYEHEQSVISFGVGNMRDKDHGISTSMIGGGSMIFTAADPQMWKDETARVAAQLVAAGNERNHKVHGLVIGCDSSWLAHYEVLKDFAVKNHLVHSAGLEKDKKSNHNHSLGQNQIQGRDLDMLSEIIDGIKILLNENESQLSSIRRTEAGLSNSTSLQSHSVAYSEIKTDLNSTEERVSVLSKSLEEKSTVLSEIEELYDVVNEKYNERTGTGAGAGDGENSHGGATGGLLKIKTALRHLKEELTLLELREGITNSELLSLRKQQNSWNLKKHHQKRIKGKYCRSMASNTEMDD